MLSCWANRARLHADIGSPWWNHINYIARDTNVVVTDDAHDLVFNILKQKLYFVHLKQLSFRTMDDMDALSCEHFVVNEKVKESLKRIADHAAKIQGKCNVCRTSRAAWCCLECFHIGCGRYEQKHAWTHATKTGHFICVNMESPKHLWCYKCDKGIVYFGDDNSSTSQHESDDTNSSPSSSHSSHQQRNTNNHRTKRMGNDIRSNLAIPPHVEFECPFTFISSCFMA